MRVWRIPPKIQVEWLTAAILLHVKSGIAIIQASRTQQLNCWAYGIKLLIQITEEYLQGLPGLAELPDEIKLNVVVEESRLRVFDAGKRDI